MAYTHIYFFLFMAYEGAFSAYKNVKSFYTGKGDQWKITGDQMWLQVITEKAFKLFCLWYLDLFIVFVYGTRGASPPPTLLPSGPLTG